ncbi:MAG: glycosyltransferase [Bdellovibrionota bacterium]
MRVLALIVDFETEAQAEKLSRQIAEQDQGVTVVHIDNGNAKPRVLSPEQRALNVRLVRAPENQGYAGGLQAGIQAFENETWEAYWFLNSDIEFESDCLPRLVHVLESNERAGAVGPRIFRGKSANIWGTRGSIHPLIGITAMGDWQRLSALPKWSYLPGCSLLVRAQALKDAGGLPERYRMYYEETHLCVALQRKGWELWVDPDARAYHDVESMKHRIPAPHFAFYFARNNLYFWKVNFGIPWFVQLPRTLFVVGKELILPLRRATSVSLASRRLGYTLAGLWDGFEFLRHPHTRFEKKLFPKSSR